MGFPTSPRWPDYLRGGAAPYPITPRPIEIGVHRWAPISDAQNQRRVLNIYQIPSMTRTLLRIGSHLSTHMFRMTERKTGKLIEKALISEFVLTKFMRTSD